MKISFVQNREFTLKKYKCDEKVNILMLLAMHIFPLFEKKERKNY